MHTRIQKAWTEGKSPIINGIVYGDDTAVLLDIAAGAVGSSYSIHVASKTTLADLERGQKLEWTYIAQLCEAKVFEEGLTIVGGEGGMGADGFIAVIRTASNQLVWLAFLDCSNPFEKVSLSDGIINAVTNLGHTWSFPLARPEAVTVTVKKQ